MVNKIGIGIVGLGRVSQSHIDAIRLNPHICQLTAVVDVNEALAQSVAETCNTKYYTSVEQALLDPDIQAMIICLPHHLHKPVALQAMETGRHVLVEKPCATNLADGKEMVAKSIEKKVVLMAGQSFRFISACREAKLRMKEEIGDPFNFIYIQACGFDEASAPLWWQDMKKTGGHAFTTVGSHNLDLILWMYEGRTPIRVYSEARSVNPKFEGMDE
ncbi:MAG: Gfo/Idh/MocA family oxidoreductase, partial [Chloroflexota bacterium]